MGTEDVKPQNWNKCLIKVVHKTHTLFCVMEPKYRNCVRNRIKLFTENHRAFMRVHEDNETICVIGLSFQ